jgi:UDP-MurNAc hydroxylase
MKLLNIGGATAILEHNGRRMLFDPWMNEGILHGSWHHWPPLKLKPSDLGHLDYIYISHVHEDHCAPETIRLLNHDAEIIIMDREPEIPNFVNRFLKYNRFDFKKIHLIRPQTPVEIAPGMVVDMVTADPAHEYNYLIDSGMILRWDGHVIYNANDCAPHPGSISYIKNTYKSIDIALIPYAGGSGYPGCYTSLSHEEKMAERERIFRSRLNLFADTIRELNPELVMPFADQYVIGGNRGHLNQYSPHPPCPGLVKDYLPDDGLKDKLLLLNSGQSYDLDSGLKAPPEPYRIYTETEREEYIESLKEKKYDHQKLAFRDAVPLERLLNHARARLWGIQQQKNNYPDTRIYLEVENIGQIYGIDFHSPNVEQVKKGGGLKQPYIKISGDSTLFSMLLINHIPWNMADGALFFDYERRPNKYDVNAYVMLNFLTV